MVLVERCKLALVDRSGTALAAAFDGLDVHCFAADITDESSNALIAQGAAALMGGINGIVNACGDNGQALGLGRPGKWPMGQFSP